MSLVRVCEVDYFVVYSELFMVCVMVEQPALLCVFSCLWGVCL